MTNRYLTVLGTASQAPSRARALGGYALQWDDQLVLFDPAEGFQRQCLVAGVVIARATAVCITHFHGDHCMGLPGIIQRRSLSGNTTDLPVYFPAEGQEYFDHLVTSSIYDDGFIRPIPVSAAGVVGQLGSSELISAPLEHLVPTIGYRVQEPAKVRLNAQRLHERGIAGPAVGELLQIGSVSVGGRLVHVEDVSEERAGQAMAFVMDTRVCPNAVKLAEGVDLLVSEATFLERDRDLADQSGHMTAHQAAMLAKQAGARKLVVSHFSGRYGLKDEQAFIDEATAVFANTVVARDFDFLGVPNRQRAFLGNQNSLPARPTFLAV